MSAEAISTLKRLAPGHALTEPSVIQRERRDFNVAILQLTVVDKCSATDAVTPLNTTEHNGTARRTALIPTILVRNISKIVPVQLEAQITTPTDTTWLPPAVN